MFLTCFVANMLIDYLSLADWVNLDLFDCVCICLIFCCWDDLTNLDLELKIMTFRVWHASAIIA